MELDRSYTSIVKLVDGKLKKVEREGNQIFFHDGLYVPSLSRNLFSVGQLLRKYYSLHFDDGVCTVYDKKNKFIVAKVGMSQNNVFFLLACH